MGKKVKAHDKFLLLFQQTGTLNLNVPAFQMFQLSVVSLRIFALLKRFALRKSFALPKIFSLNLFYNCKVLMKFVFSSASSSSYFGWLWRSICLQNFSYKFSYEALPIGKSVTYCLVANSLRR
jgi:hypothetical protein